MVSQARVGHYTHLPNDAERDAIRMASKADEAYLLDLQSVINSHKSLIAQLECTYKEVKNRIELRNSLIAPHRYLPNEILGYIFSLVEFDPYCHFPSQGPNTPPPSPSSRVSPREWASRCPFNVSHACRHWREVALTTPTLWSWLIVDAQKKIPYQMMKHWFEHSKTTPMDVTIWRERLQQGAARPIKRFMQMVSMIMGSRMHQVKRLRVCCQVPLDSSQTLTADQDLSVIFQALTFMVNGAVKLPKNFVVDSMESKLNTIRYSSSISMPPPVPASLLNTLTSFHVRGFFVSGMLFSSVLSCLTSLKLDGPAGGDEVYYIPPRLPFYPLLSSLPQLVRLRLKGCYSPLSSEIDDFLRLQYSVSLPCLERLTLVGCVFTAHIFLLAAPNLRTFKLKGDYGWREPSHSEPSLRWGSIQESVEKFLEESGDKITKFVLDRVGEDVHWDVLMSWWERMENLEHLVIKQSAVAFDCPADLRDKEGWLFSSPPAALEWRLQEP